MEPGTKHRFHEFFAGSGLVSCGLSDSFRSVWANDVSERKARVYRANFDPQVLHVGDIADVKGSRLPVASLSWASFPCQDLSLAGNIEGIYSERSGLVWQWLRVLDEQGDDAPRVAEPGEIAMDAARGAGEFYDYETKYLAHDAVAMVCPAPIAPQERELLMITAARAFEAIGAEGLARVDFFLTPDGRAIVNEVNTMPGFTPFSMYPYMWRKSGMTYPELVTELIELALARPADVNR